MDNWAYGVVAILVVAFFTFLGSLVWTHHTAQMACIQKEMTWANGSCVKVK